jgi:hypothetical protein
VRNLWRAARIGVAQFVVFLLMLGWVTAKKKEAVEVEKGKPTDAAP